MKKFHFINFLNQNLKEAYLQSLVTDIYDKELLWKKIYAYIDEFKNSKLDKDEIEQLLKYLTNDDKLYLVDLLKKSNKYNGLIDGKIFNFEEVVSVDNKVFSKVLSAFNLKDIAKACMAASPEVISYISECVNTESLEEERKKLGSVSIKEITSIHDLIIKNINEQV